MNLPKGKQGKPQPSRGIGRMKRKAGVMMLLAALSAWSSPAARAGSYMSHVWNNTPDGAQISVHYQPDSPGLIGPWGQPVAATAPANFTGPTGADYARMALAQTFPPELLQAAYPNQGGGMPLQLMGYPPPPAPAPGMPGVSGPGGPGPALPAGPLPGGLRNPPGAVAAIGALVGPAPTPFGVCRSEVRFVGPAGMKISWYAPRADGHVGFTSQYLEAPARYNFLQSSIYRLKLSDIPARPGVELYPTLEVVPANIKTATFLAHSAIPVSFTEEDLEQVAAGNFVVKVIYLPDPQYQDLAATGPDEVVSSRLEPGVDPILEAKRRGSILAIVRLGNIDLEAPNTPAMDAPPQGNGGHGPYHGMPGMPPVGPPGMPGASAMVPPGPGGMPGSMPPVPTMPATQGVPSAPTVPLPLPAGTPQAPTTPLGKLSTTGSVQQVGFTTNGSR
jgi:hypothetical protein